MATADRPVEDHLAYVGIIMNPRSAGGRTARAWPAIRSRLEAVCKSISVRETQASGHATRLAGELLRSGVRTIVAIGGDGTLSEIVNGILETPTGDRDVLLGLIPEGSGSDFRRTARIPLSETAAIDVIRQGRVARFDVMRVTYRDPAGATAVRHAINLTSFGMGGRVAARANRSSKPAGATLAFLAATAVTAAGFRGDRVTIRLDGGESFDGLITNVAVGNGQYHGSGMRVCPRALPDDGLLDITIIERLSLWEIVRNARLLFNGRIYDHARIHHYRTRTLTARSEGDSALEIDGEPLGYLPVEIAIVPSAVSFIVP